MVWIGLMAESGGLVGDMLVFLSECWLDPRYGNFEMRYTGRAAFVLGRGCAPSWLCSVIIE
jgi:hypothetical protein